MNLIGLFINLYRSIDVHYFSINIFYFQILPSFDRSTESNNHYLHHIHTDTDTDARYS